MCLPSREALAGGLNWWGCPSLGSHPTAPCQSFQHKASALQLVQFAFWVKNFHPELKMALEHYGFCCFLSLCRQIELCPRLRNDGFHFLSVGNTQRSVSVKDHSWHFGWFDLSLTYKLLGWIPAWCCWVLFSSVSEGCPDFSPQRNFMLWNSILHSAVVLKYKTKVWMFQKIYNKWNINVFWGKWRIWKVETEG